MKANKRLAIVQASVDQLTQMSQEEQLQVQRAIINGSSNEIAQAYAEYNSSNWIVFWYLLAQEMEKGRVVNVPSDYQLLAEAQRLWILSKAMTLNGNLPLSATWFL